MNTANVQPERRPVGEGNGAQRTPVMVVAGIAFLVLFAAWIPVRQWLVSLFGESNDLAIGLSSAALWLLVFALVVAAVVQRTDADFRPARPSARTATIPSRLASEIRRGAIPSSRSRPIGPDPP